MDTKLAVYQHSGRLGSGVVVVPVAAVIAAVVLSFAYAYADVYSPIAGYVSIILVAVFGGATGERVKTRSRRSTSSAVKSQRFSTCRRPPNSHSASPALPPTPPKPGRGAGGACAAESAAASVSGRSIGTISTSSAC